MATQKGRNWSSGDIVTAANLSSVERGVSAMAEEYTPTTWANGDTVTAAALNKIEQGIANAEGGGSSDFSTAQVTVVNNANTDVHLLGALIDHDAINFETTISIIPSNHTIEAILYKAEGLFVVDDEGATITVSGDAELDETAVFITGDCTITLSSGQTAA